MPYVWTDSTRRRMELRPHRSLPRRGFAAVIGLFFLLATIPFYGLLGTVYLWTLLPFAMAALAALWFALEGSYRTGRVTEVLEIGPETTLLTRTDPDGATRDWRCNTYWVRAELHPIGGPVPFYVTLSGNGRRVEIGAFLSEDERKALHSDLKRRLAV